jgi:hypothetical protein
MRCPRCGQLGPDYTASVCLVPLMLDVSVGDLAGSAACMEWAMGVAGGLGGYSRKMELGPGEPAAGPWRVEAVDVFAR